MGMQTRSTGAEPARDTSQSVRLEFHGFERLRGLFSLTQDDYVKLTHPAYVERSQSSPSSSVASSSSSSSPPHIPSLIYFSVASTACASLRRSLVGPKCTDYQ
eukprot:GHVU01231058.1.p2 GENE.GHVU01231058.1~~GHVU01231058.1.p2  ORF type:complete len:103 (+),score=11.49 GHVU01231058.1:176-484(+)